MRARRLRFTSLLIVVLAALSAAAAWADEFWQGRRRQRWRHHHGSSRPNANEDSASRHRLPEVGPGLRESGEESDLELAFGQVVKVEGHGLDRYGRTIAEVVLPDGRSLNQELVRQGVAWWYRRTPRMTNSPRLKPKQRPKAGTLVSTKSGSALGVATETAGTYSD